VILSSQSIFAEGVAARLKQYLDEPPLLIDVREGDALGQVVAARPAAVILDASDPAEDRLCSLGTLLTALPAITVVRLDPQKDHVQVVTSAQHSMSQVQDLIDLIKAA
jgi:hypothetical protein